MRRATLIAAVFLLMVTGGLGVPSAMATTAFDGMVGQADIDGSASSNPGWTSGGWADASGGVAGRPYVRNLSVTNGGTTTAVIVGGSAGEVPTPIGGSDLTAIVTPINVCLPGTSTNCYSSPNRVQVTLAYLSGGQYHYDLSRRSGAAVPAVDTSSVIDIELGLNTTGSTLGWSWATGAPSFWSTAGIGSVDGTIRLRATPGIQPVMESGAGCSAIPVSTCDIVQADDDFLTSMLLLSLDNTLGSAFAGALFATDGAMIGSLEAVSGGSGLAYGAASTHLTDTGGTRTGVIRGVLSSKLLTDVLGVTENPETVLAVERTNGPGSTGTISYEPWSSAVNGTDGYLVTIPGVTFSAPKYTVVKGQSGGDQPGGQISVAVRAKRASVLMANVDPDLGAGAWNAQIQKLQGKRWKTKVRTSTSGPQETIVRDLPKGRYRVVVPTQSGYQGATSSVVNLRR